jgi:hypothetical protein
MALGFDESNARKGVLKNEAQMASDYLSLTSLARAALWRSQCRQPAKWTDQGDAGARCALLHRQWARLLSSSIDPPACFS